MASGIGKSSLKAHPSTLRKALSKKMRIKKAPDANAVSAVRKASDAKAASAVIKAPELMSPVGSYESLAAAIKAGCDSVYFGAGSLDMRSHSAKRLGMADIRKISAICHKNSVRCYLTVNSVIYDDEMDRMKALLDEARNAAVDGVIAHDIAVLEYAKSRGMKLHCSTQANISNIESVRFYSRYADVVILARELSLRQIRDICSEAGKQGIRGPSGEIVRIEAFVHGALCVSISGKCYMSLAQYNKSANRGECLHACRRSYTVKDDETGEELRVENRFVMSPKDLCTIRIADKLIYSGISVFKIEGRGRSADYVYKTTKAYREAIDACIEGTYTKKKIAGWEKSLSEAFNRGFWHNGYYMGKRLGEWSSTYGSKSTTEKEFVGIVRNYYPKAGVAEIEMQTGTILTGDRLLFTGITTGVHETKAEGMRVDDKAVRNASKGDIMTIQSGEKLRKNDNVFVVRKRKEILSII